MAGGVVRVGEKHERGVLVAGPGQGRQVEGEVRPERRLAQLHAAQPRLLDVDGKARGKGHHVVHPRPAGDAHKQVDDLVRTVAGHHALLGHAVEGGQGGGQGGVAGPGIAEDHVGLAGQHPLDERRGAQRVFVAGQLDHAGQAVLFLDLFHGKAGRVGGEFPYVVPDPVAGLHLGYSKKGLPRRVAAGEVGCRGSGGRQAHRVRGCVAAHAPGSDDTRSFPTRRSGSPRTRR